MTRDASTMFRHKGATRGPAATAGFYGLLLLFLAGAGDNREAVMFASISGGALCVLGIWLLTRKVALTVTPEKIVCTHVFHTKRYPLDDVLKVGTWVGRTRWFQVGSIAVLTVDTATGRHVFEPFRMSRHKLSKLKSVAEDANRWIEHYKSTGGGGVRSE